MLWASMEGGDDVSDERTREEYLAWCKQRALEYLPHDPTAAFASFVSEVAKHPETEAIQHNPFLAMSMVSFMTWTEHQQREWINGWN